MNGHPTREEDFDLYALGALESDEKHAIDSHVSSCAGCARKLAEARGRMALLALAAPRVEPSPVVKQRLMQLVHSGGPAVPRYVVPGRPSGFFGRWWAAILIPATAVLALATLGLWNENRLLDRQLASLHASIQQQQDQLTETRAVAEVVADPATVIVPLAQQVGAPQGSARVIYNARLRTVMYSGQIEPAPAGKSYQLWLVPTQGNPISAGVFNPVRGQADRITMKVPAGVSAKAFAVTLEPAGGTTQPTGPKVLVGPAS
jgi:anti-sigma-K factor RskA